MRRRERAIIAVSRLNTLILGQRRAETATSLLLAKLGSGVRSTAGPRGVVRRSGLVWELDTRDNLQRTLYFTGSYEWATIQEALRRVPEDGVVLDVGANIGTFALPIARALPRSRVVAVEPSPVTLQRLKRHVDMNDLTKRVTLIPSALGARAGRIALRATAQHGVQDIGTWSFSGDGEESVEVPVQRGDDLVADLRLGRLDLVKIDVEGAELDVLVGLRQVLLRYRPSVICEIVSGLQNRGGHQVSELVSFLSALGYRPYAVRTRGVEPLIEGWSGNVLFEHSG